MFVFKFIAIHYPGLAFYGERPVNVSYQLVHSDYTVQACAADCSKLSWCKSFAINSVALTSTYNQLTCFLMRPSRADLLRNDGVGAILDGYSSYTLYDPLRFRTSYPSPAERK